MLSILFQAAFSRVFLKALRIEKKIKQKFTLRKGKI